MYFKTKKEQEEAMYAHLNDLEDIANALKRKELNRKDILKIVNQKLSIQNSLIVQSEAKDEINFWKKTAYDLMTGFPKNSDLNRLYYKAYQDIKEIDNASEIADRLNMAVQEASKLLTTEKNVEYSIWNARKKLGIKNLSKHQVEEILNKHERWLNEDPEGVRADLSYVDLRGYDFEGRDLSQAILNYTDLSYTNLQYSILRNAEGTGVKFNHAKLAVADLTEGNFTSCDFSDTRLDAINITDTKLIGCIIHPKSCRAIRIENTNFERSVFNDQFTEILKNEGLLLKTLQSQVKGFSLE